MSIDAKKLFEKSKDRFASDSNLLNESFNHYKNRSVDVFYESSNESVNIMSDEQLVNAILNDELLFDIKGNRRLFRENLRKYGVKGLHMPC